MIEIYEKSDRLQLTNGFIQYRRIESKLGIKWFKLKIPKEQFVVKLFISSPGRSPGRAIVLPPASVSVLAKCSSFYDQAYYVMGKRCQASYPVPVTGLVILAPSR